MYWIILIAFAMATEPKNQSTSDLHIKSEDTIRVSPTSTPATADVVQVKPTAPEDASESEGRKFQSTQTEIMFIIPRGSLL